MIKCSLLASSLSPSRAEAKLVRAIPADYIRGIVTVNYHWAYKATILTICFLTHWYGSSTISLKTLRDSNTRFFHCIPGIHEGTYRTIKQAHISSYSLNDRETKLTDRQYISQESTR